MSKERLEELAYNVAATYDGRAVMSGDDYSFLYEYALDQAERVQDQQATIDSLSMAHDAIHREIPKDKHTLIKNIIGLNGKVKELEKDNEDIRWMCADMSIKLQKIEQQNERYRELINTITYRLDGRDIYSANTVIDAIQIDIDEFMEDE